jgi:isopentenyldiphosphate isomerase
MRQVRCLKELPLAVKFIAKVKYHSCECTFDVGTHSPVGLFHRVAHVLVYNSAGELLIQKRMPNKDIEGSKWDLSCAEHVQPGERSVRITDRLLCSVFLTPEVLIGTAMKRPRSEV